MVFVARLVNVTDDVNVHEVGRHVRGDGKSYIRHYKARDSWSGVATNSVYSEKVVYYCNNWLNNKF